MARDLQPVPGSNGRDRGFVLVVALWVTALLAVAALSLTRTVQTDVRIAANMAALAAAQGLAEAGIALAVADLAATAADSRTEPRLPRTPDERFACALGDGTVALRLQSAAGRVDLNQAPRRLLAALMAGHGIPAEEALRLAGRIVDWRDDDDRPGPEGAERAAYLEAGRTDGPRNQPFDTVQEIDRVLGIDAGLARRLAPDLTVHSGHSGVDPTAATAVLTSRLLAGAGLLPAEPGPGLRRSDPAAGLFVRAAGRIYIVTALGQMASGASAAVQAVVEVNPTGGGPPVVRAWTSGLTDEGLGVGLGADIPSC